MTFVLFFWISFFLTPSGFAQPEGSPENATVPIPTELLRPLTPAPVECIPSQVTLESPEFCSHPFDVICASHPQEDPTSSPTQVSKTIIAGVERAVGGKEELEKISTQLSTLLSGRAWSYNKAEAFSTYSEIITQVQNQVVRHLRAKGITQKNFENEISKIRQQLTQRVKLSSKFRKTDPPSNHFTENVIQKIQEIELMIPTSIDTFELFEGSQASNLFTFYVACGVDGLQTQAVYSPTHNSMVICPGFLLQLASTGSLDGLSFMVGHEMGHSIDVLTEEDKATDSPTKFPYLDSYQHLLSCFEKNHSERLRPIQEASDYIQKEGIPALQKKLEKLLAETPPDEDQIYGVKRRLEMARQAIRKMHFKHQNFQRNFATLKPSATQTHSEELCADYFGVEAIADLLESMTQESTPQKTQQRKREAFAAQFRILCDRRNDPNLQLLWGQTQPDNGTHPPLEFRVEYALKNPRTRKALGCETPLVGEKPWCSLEGEVFPAALPAE